MNIYICDFDDSFTYNIFSELSHLTDPKKIKVITKDRILNLLQHLEAEEEKSVLILGPGPGNPDAYSYLFSVIRRIIKKPNIFCLGICLGHQIIWKVLGAKIIHSSEPIHGRSVIYKLGEDLSQKTGLPLEIQVQRYNSLAVKKDQLLLEMLEQQGSDYHFHNNELILTKNTHILTYQFHPESVGTTCPKSFFEPMLNFLL